MTLIIPADLLRKYNKPGPRYTSYPTAPVWTDAFGSDDHAASLRASAETPETPLSMYVHIPYCTSMCFYCGCSVIITQQKSKGMRYVGGVLAEARLAREIMGSSRPVSQHHWGGGTPTFLNPEELETLFRGLTEIYPVTDDAEVSIEVDPRVTSREQLEVLRRCGFNRISMGVQDFNPKVQEAIHRVQSFEMTRDLVNDARELGFDSVNLDIVYGLPHQNQEVFKASIEKVLELDPDRIACYSFAYVPWIKKHQEVIPKDALPSGEEKMALYLTALRMFQDAGHTATGMDHFAKTTDGLVTAMNKGTLHRNFMGYTTHAAEDMLSFGVTSISEMNGAFAHNTKSVQDWEESVKAGRLPVVSGHRRSADDNLRRRIILDLMCHFRLNYDDYGGQAKFTDQFAAAIHKITAMAEDGLAEVDATGISVTELGRLFIRNLCMPFDAYLDAQQKGTKPVFSRTV